jgi:outer membrane protein insertion porin family
MNGTNGMKKAIDSNVWKRTLALLGCAAVFLLGAPVLAQNGTPRGPIVADVVIEGLRTTPREKLLQYLYTKPGREYSQTIAQQDFERLAKSHLCRPVEVKLEATTDQRVIVIFLVQEYKHVVREIIYKHVKHETVTELEKLTHIQVGMPLDKTLNTIACFAIQDYLQKEGYYFANVTLLEGQDDSHDRVVFNITEGPKVRVRDIFFVGQNELATGRRLRTSQIDTGAAFLATFGGVFNPAMIDNDVLKLEEYYRKNGYLNVHVSRELQFSDDFHFVDVTFHIQEGLRYRVADSVIEGKSHFSREELASVTRVKKGDYYNETIVTTDVNYLTAYCGFRAYQTEVKKIVTEVPDSPGMVRVLYVVEEKMPAKVGEVIIVGNAVTKDRVIRRVVNLYPGQDLSYPDLKGIENSLSRMNIFETNPEKGIRPTVTVLDNPGPLKDILVKVEETRTGSLMLGAGVNSDSGLVGSIVLNERNFDILRFPESWSDFFEGKAFRGGGQELRIEAVPGTEVQRYSITIREPFLFDQPYSLTSSVYYRDRIFDEYTENRYGMRETLSHMFTKAWSASIGFRLEEVGVNNIEAGAPVDYTSQYGHHFLVAPNAAVTYDTRDSYIRPGEGGKAELGVEEVFTEGTSFPIVNLEGSRYFTLWQRPDGSGKHILAFRSQFTYAFSNDVPVFERFFAGGYNSIRGFEFRGVGPNTDGFMVGGNFQFLNSVEYQIPIRANDQLYMVAFIDSGTVESKFTITDYRVSAGFGLRISLPMLGPVPIALDFGFPIVRASTDRTQLFSFFIGMAH